MSLLRGPRRILGLHSCWGDTGPQGSLQHQEHMVVVWLPTGPSGFSGPELRHAQPSAPEPGTERAHSWWTATSARHKDLQVTGHKAVMPPQTTETHQLSLLGKSPLQTPADLGRCPNCGFSHSQRAEG